MWQALAAGATATDVPAANAAAPTAKAKRFMLRPLVSIQLLSACANFSQRAGYSLRIL